MPDDTKGETIALGCLALLLAFVPLLLLRGVTLHILWGWFITPAFSLPSPGIWMCLGLAMVARAFLPEGETERKKKPFAEEVVTLIVRPLFLSGMTLAFGFLVHCFV